MKKITADIHTHSIASGHAYGTIREMAQAASEMQLKVLGISEHGPGVPGTVEPIYFRNLSAVPGTLYGVQIIHGCEMNVLNDGSISLEESCLERLDYAIAGIHVLCYTDEGRIRNTKNVIACMKHPKVKLISHPDDDTTPLDYELLVRGAYETGTALEVNNSSLAKPQRRLNCFENYRCMLDWCRKLGVPVVASSDAHDPSQVGHVELVLDFLDQVGFPESLILNLDADRLMDFLKN